LNSTKTCREYCTKIVFGRGSAPGPNRDLTALHRPSSWFKGSYFLGEGREEEGKKRQEGERKGRERDGKDRPPFRKSLDSPLAMPVILGFNCTCPFVEM